jgi:hypothetical protein
MAQIDSGVLDENTTLVTLSLGGNDGNAFVHAVSECSGLGSCASDSGFLPRYKSTIDSTKTKLSTTVSLVHAKAPNAKIVLLSYPELLSRTVKCAGSGYIDMPEVAALAELAGYMATTEGSRRLPARRRNTGLRGEHDRRLRRPRRVRLRRMAPQDQDRRERRR